jgi:KTSC domain
MERQPVASSLIRSVGYDLLGSILEIEMGEPSRLYTFYDVPFSVYEELMEAPSKGQYFNENIRDFYAYQATDGPPPPEMPDDADEADQPE